MLEAPTRRYSNSLVRFGIHDLMRISMFLCVAGVSAEAAPRNIAIVPIPRLDEAWWHKRFDEKATELHAGPVDLVWLGDSITQNWELDGPQPWRRFAPVWKRFYGDRHAINLGFKGDSTCHVLWRIQHGELAGIAPKGVVLLIGANNFGHVHTDAKQTEAGINVVVDEIHQRLPGAHIVLLAVLPSLRSKWVSDNTARLNADLSHVFDGRTYVSYLNLAPLFVHDGQIDKTKFLDIYLTPPDPPLHPTAQMEEQIAIAIEPLVAHMLGDHIHR